MALSASTLKDLMKSAIDGIDIENGEVSNDAALDALAQAIVDHITSDAQVVISSGSSAGTYQIL